MESQYNTIIYLFKRLYSKINLNSILNYFFLSFGFYIVLNDQILVDQIIYTNIINLFITSKF
jgi:hypothetical protein